MSYIFDFSDSKVGFDANGFLFDYPFVPMLDEDTLKLVYKAAKGGIEGFDPRFDATWFFEGKAVGKTTKTVEKLRDKPLSEVTFKQDTSDGVLKFTINGREATPDGGHPDLTLDVFLTTQFSAINTGDDRFIGSNYADTIFGGDGNDVMLGRGGADSLNGRAGADVIKGGGGDDALISSGKSKLYGGGGDDKLYFGAEGTKVFGGKGDDVIRAILAEGAGSLFGGKGADDIAGDHYNDLIFGGGGDDILMGAKGNDKIKGQGGADEIDGGDGADKLFGGGGDDDLEAGNGNDRLYGGSGNDDFLLEHGSDTAFGGKGNDHFMVDRGSHEMSGGGGVDVFTFADTSFGDKFNAVITDFEDGADQIGFVSYITGIHTPEDFKSVKDTADGLRLETDTGWVVFLEGMKKRDFSHEDIDVLEG